MAFRCIIKIDGIQGTSALKDGWIDVMSYHWGATNNVKAWEKQHSGVAHVSDFSIVKRVDPSSPDILTHCVNGKKATKIEVSLVHAAGDAHPKEFAKYTFETCYLTSVRPGGAGHGEDPLEEVSWNYAKAEYSYGSKKGSFDVGKGGILGQ